MGTKSQCESGLSHLVQAATALKALLSDHEAPNSNMHEGALDGIVSDDDDCHQPIFADKQRKRKSFPQKLMNMLSDDSIADIVSWLPHGRSFVVLRPDIFTTEILPKYLPPIDSRTSTKYPSFTRKLNRWGFRQATKGPDTGAFHHPNFRRDNPNLLLHMECQKSYERQSAPKGNLPPKKRCRGKMSSTGTSAATESPTLRARIQSTIVSVSTDDRSEVSFGNSTATSVFSSQEFPLVLPATSLGKAACPNSPLISNDADFVAATLRQRDIGEVFRAARAMLYEAYLRVLKDGQQQNLPS
eukprot:scaffold3450_cov114-Cylindrotheca_fusiformis.AAC.32